MEPPVESDEVTEPVDDRKAEDLFIRLRLCMPEPGLDSSSVCVSSSFCFFL